MNNQFDLRSFMEQRKMVKAKHVNLVKNKVGQRTFDFLRTETQSLLINTEIMSSLIRNTPTNIDLGLIDDYSFLLFPAAKAYEGFLKQLSEKVNFVFSKKKKTQKITKELLEKEPDFGIGIIFNEITNPEIKNALLDKSRYKNHPNFMKAIWDKCRCDILHYDYKKPIIISLKQSEDEISLIYRAIRWGFEGYVDTPDYSVEELLRSLKIPKPSLTG